MRHAQRSEDSLPDGPLPSQSCKLPFQIAHGHDGEIVVLVGTSKALVGLKVAKPADHILAAEIRRIPNQIVPWQSRAMREKVAGRGALAGHHVIHLKFWQILPDRLVPIGLAFVL